MSRTIPHEHMITKLPRWIWTGAWALSFIAGIVNVVGLLGFEHQAITHLTGNTSMLAEAVASFNLVSTLHFAALIGSFVAGCALSGFIIQDSTLQLGRRYGVALFIVAILLFVSVPLLEHQSSYGMYTAAGACGLQNAMVSTYSGAVVRTTHVSGMFTDLGIFLGHSLRGVPIDSRRLKLSITVISGFFCGGVIGAFLYQSIAYSALYIPSGLTALVAVTYAIFRKRKSESRE